MVNSASTSLAARIACIGNQPEPVRQKRDAFLAAVGQVEMLVNYGVQSASRLAHGRYQASLTSPIAGKEKLAPIAQAELTEAVEALEQALPVLAEQMNACACWTVSQAAPPAVAQIIAELDESTARLKAVRTLVGQWKLALDDYARATTLNTRRAAVVLPPPLEPLTPPDLT